MQASLGRRLPVVFLLLVALFGLCVWFGTVGPAPGLGAYPDESDVGPTPNPYVGGPVELSGTVVGTSPVQIRIEHGLNESRTLTITNLELNANQGETLRVYGTLVDTETVRAMNAFTVPPGGLRYTYTVSFIAGLWVLFRLTSQWRLDPQQGLARRSDSDTPLDRLRARLSRGSDDA